MTGGRLFRPRLVFGGRSERTAPAGASDGPAPSYDGRFRALMLPHLDAAFNLARYLARDASAAEDIVQTAFLKALRSFSSWRGDNARAWLLAIVRNAFLDWLREQASETAYDEDAPPPNVVEATIDLVDAETPHVILARREAVDTARAAIEALPEPFRETIVLRELEQLSYRDIAAICGVPIGTVMSRLARGRQMLADWLLPSDGGVTELRT